MSRTRAERLADARLYLCTDARERQGDLPQFLDTVLAAGVDVVQLRQKGVEAGQEIEYLEVFADACRRHGRLLAVNDRADVAYVARPDLLHLGQGDLPVPAARAILGQDSPSQDSPSQDSPSQDSPSRDILIGRSTHSEAEAAAAATEPGVGYFCVGPVWPTPTKPGRPAPGLDLVGYAARLPSCRPWFAIGGIDAGSLGAVLDRGARRVVVVRAVTAAEDPGEAAATLARRLRERDAG